MSQTDFWSETAKEIVSSVEKAVKSQDFQNLGNQIKGSVTEALKKSGIDPGSRNREKPPEKGNVAPGSAPYQNQSSGINRTMVVKGVRSYLDETPTTPWFQKRVSKNMGLGSLIGGGIGVFLAGIPAVVCLIMGLTLSPAFLIGAGVLGGLTALSVYLLSRGGSLQSLVSRFYTYGDIAGNREYVTIDELSRQTGNSRFKILSDIRKFRRKEMLPMAVVDRDESTLMLTEKAYREYKAVDDQRAAEKRELAEKEREKIELENSDLPEDVKDLLAEGQAYLLKVRNYNDEIPDTESMSTKLYELENICKRIFAQVRKDPGSAKELRKFMNYYLPTTDKLLSSYVEISKQGGSGENLRSTKEEIESAMDTINDAFERLLDKLFETTAWDVSSDISVMKTMMEQDGLREKDKEKEKVLV